MKEATTLKVPYIKIVTLPVFSNHPVVCMLFLSMCTSSPLVLKAPPTVQRSAYQAKCQHRNGSHQILSYADRYADRCKCASGWLFVPQCGSSYPLKNSSAFFPQYEPGVLEACLKLLQVSPQHLGDVKQDYILRADPVYLCRVICAMVRQKNKQTHKPTHQRQLRPAGQFKAETSQSPTWKSSCLGGKLRW